MDKKMMEKLKDDSIKNEELFDCLNSKKIAMVGLSILKIMDRKYCDDKIIQALKSMMPVPNGYKAVGPYQIGHLAIAALFLVEDKAALESYKQSYHALSDNDKFLVDNFIKQMNKSRGLMNEL